MENRKELKTSYKIALIICSILVFANIVIEITQMVKFISTDISKAVWPMIGILSLSAALYYAYVEYKRPHGNFLRNVFLINALLDAAFIVTCLLNMPKHIVAINLLAVVLKAFMAGRLNKFKQNTVIIAIVGMCSLIYGACSFVSVAEDASVIIRLFHSFSSSLGWATLSVAYITRYEPHIEAGLQEDNK